MSKKDIRKTFRLNCLNRDRWTCVTCGKKGVKEPQNGLAEDVGLDVHHITNRKHIAHGGYVKENGISLCPTCHLKAEESTPGYEPKQLYTMIGSSYEKACKAAEEMS